MERFVIVMPVGTSAYLLPCDDGDTCKLETLQNLVGGPIEVVDSCLAGNWSRESDVEAVKLVVNEEGSYGICRRTRTPRPFTPTTLWTRWWARRRWWPCGART